MMKEDLVHQIAAFTSRFVPLNIVEDVVGAIRDAGLRIVSQDAAVLPPPNTPLDCTDEECQELSQRLPGDCDRCTNRKPQVIP
jgi:hypothetical protein